MADKLQDPSTAPKTYWAIVIRLLYNKKIPPIPLQYFNWLMVNLLQIFVKRQIFLIIFF